MTDTMTDTTTDSVPGATSAITTGSMERNRSST